MDTTTIQIDYLTHLIKVEAKAKELESKVRQLEMIIDILNKKVEDARPHMEAIRRAQTEDKTVTIDYHYEIK